MLAGGGERGRVCDSGGNVSEPAAGLHPADGLRLLQSVQETLHQHQRQHGGTQRGQDTTQCALRNVHYAMYTRSEGVTSSTLYVCHAQH